MGRSGQGSRVEAERSYSAEAVQGILEVAMAGAQAQRFSRQQLMEMAAELSIDPQMLTAAEKTWDQQQEKQQRQQRWRQYLRGQWVIFAGVNSGLVLINLLTFSGVFWAIFPILGWGITLGIMSLMPGGSVVFHPSRSSHCSLGWCHPGSFRSPGSSTGTYPPH